MSGNFDVFCVMCCYHDVIKCRQWFFHFYSQVNFYLVSNFSSVRMKCLLFSFEILSLLIYVLVGYPRFGVSNYYNIL